MLLFLIPIAIWLIGSFLDRKNEEEIEAMMWHDELMTQIEQDAIDAEERHLEEMRERAELRRAIAEENKRHRIRRTERKVIHNSDGSYVAKEVTEEEILSKSNKEQ